MKFRKAAAAAVIAAAILSLASCTDADSASSNAISVSPSDNTGSVSEIEVDIPSFGEKIHSQVRFDDDLTEISASKAVKLYNLTVEPESCSVYSSTGATPEEISLWKAASDADAVTIKAAVETRISKLRDSFTDYRPEEMPKLDKAVVVSNGKYVFMCVSADEEKAASLLKDALGAS